MSAEQWKREFLRWSVINPSDIIIFSSKTINRAKNSNQFKFLFVPFEDDIDGKKKKEVFDKKTMVLICTYSMLSTSEERRAGNSKAMMEFIRSHDWGIMLMDEVQVVPANNFRKINEHVKAHCKLGLTATLVREDGRIQDLLFLIGPKLYEANWIDLQERGYLARV